ncbi:TcdA/TcdB pore-forming domain-containing protein [Pseudomonas sp. TWP3-2]|uniref:TcdA/TcdB pore-forming domain-containing protein n=1 Tax=Pseudomonas sp. TWP3-2 TaxID=2804574 RepID=UPI003CEC254E
MQGAKESGGDGGYVKFVNLFKLSDLEQALLPHKGTRQYDAVIRYYFACIGLLDSPRLVQPLALFKQALAEFGAQRKRRDAENVPAPSPETETAPDLAEISDRVDGFASRLNYSLELMKTAATPVPKILHFVWLGGGLGDIQRDYINLWKKVLAGQGYKINLWYDSDALLAYQTTKLLVDAAKVHSMQSGGVDSATQEQLEALYVARAIVLKQQMFAHINAARAGGLSADEARVQLLSRAYGQQAKDLHSLKARNLKSLQEVGGGDLELRDLAGAATPMQLQDIYDQEMGLRGNLAGGSDVVRLEAMLPEGGMYSDVDNLPPLLKVLGGVDISKFKPASKRAITQLLLDHNPHWMPGRQAIRDRYQNVDQFIPQEHRTALEAFAKSAPALDQVFQAPSDLLARPYMLRAVAEEGSLSNAWLMAHPNAPMVQSVLDRLRFNFDVINAVANAAMAKGIAPDDAQANFELADAEIVRRLGPLEELPGTRAVAMQRLEMAIAEYFSDGILPAREGTIHLTGPGGMRLGMEDYAQENLTPRAAEASHAELGIEPLGTVNRSTEEEQDHSWKENETDAAKWVETQKQQWRDGQFKTRYTGDITELLKHSTVEFELGWPIIEGRHVLNTELLQRMADKLGEPFTKAMMSSHDGPVVFTERLPLGFDDRQTIRGQDLRLRPPASLSTKETQGLALDEVLIRLGKNKFHLEQLSPLQRLTLGGLLGAPTLDDRSFAALSVAQDNLINSVRERGTAERYAVIEKQLAARMTPSFKAGLDSPLEQHPTRSPSSLSLKKTALSSAVTLFEWGRQVAKIREVATREYREQVKERLEQVLDQAIAKTGRMVPQDMLLAQKDGTPAGRCFPLALAMSAALARGEMSTRELFGRFYLAVDEPAASDSVTFLTALEELRSVQISEVGSVLGRVDLDKVVATVEESAGTRTLMLNSDNHSMLVAKTVQGTAATYHFYDPNFGLFEFNSADTFKATVTQFFKVPGLAEHYAVFGQPGLPQFDLIDVHAEQVAELELSPEVKVAHLLEEGTLPGMPARSVRQRVNSAHGRSLIANPRLGNSLLKLDNHWWAEQIADVTSRLQEGHESVTPLVPLFDSLEVTPEGSYRVSMVDPKSGEHVATVISRDGRLLRIKGYLSELFSTLAQKPARTNAPVDPTEAAAIHTLNAGFAVQALMNALRTREGADRTLTTAVQWHAYVNYAQLVHGNVVDVAGLIGLVQTALRDEKIIARTSAQVVGEALGPLAGKAVGAAGHVANEGLGAVLGLANVGFDIYQLVNAQNDVETATYGTQLGFDAASLVLTGAGLGAALLGAGTAAAVLGGAGVILGGLAVGVAALAQNYAMIAEEAKAVGLFFAELEQAHHADGYSYNGTQGAWLPRPSLIIRQLDLRAGKLQLDSTRLYPLRNHFGVPEFEGDYSRAINLSAELGYPDEMNFAPPAGQPIVLPCTPLNCYRYVYQTLPFASQRHDQGFDIARRLEKKKPDGQWLFLFSFYSFPSHYIVYQIYPDYRPVEISVKLDALERKLVVPVIPAPWHGKISYRLQGGAGTCTLVLNPGVNVALEASAAQKDRWIIVAPWARESDIVSGKNGQFRVKDCQFEVTGTVAPELFVLVENGKLFRIAGGVLNLLQDEPPKGVDAQVLQDHLQALARAHRLTLRYTPIHDYLIPFEKPDAPRYITGWYDAVEDRILYVRDDEVSGEDILLSVVVGESAFFHDPSSYDIWQVDANTGLLSHRYRLLVRQESESTIRSVEADSHGVVHVMQEYAHVDGSVERINYLIHDGVLWLSSITRGAEPTFDALLDDTAPLADWAPVLGEHTVFKAPHEKKYATVDWQLAAYVSVCWKIEDNARDMAWIRTRDDLIIRPVPVLHRARGWADSIQNLNDLMLLTVAHDNDVFVIYDRKLQRLCRVQHTVVEGTGQWSQRWVQPDGLTQIAVQDDGYLANTRDGLSFAIGADGEVRFAGLGEQWLKGRTKWWLELEAVANKHGVEPFAIVGVANAANDARLHGWYVDNRLLLCAAQQADVRLLGVTPDNQSAWLFEASSGEIWRQAFIDSQQLDQAFGTGTQLLQADVLPKPERQWAPWHFADVRIDGAGLLGTTLDDVVLELQFGEPPTIAGVGRDWVAAHSEQLTHDLQALLEMQSHRPFISVAAQDASVRWYIVDSARLIRVASADLPADFELLGTRRHTDVLLHEPQELLVQGYPSKRQIGPLDYVERNAEVLVIEGRVDAHDLRPLIPDDVRTLVVRMGGGFMKCHLTQALSRRLDAVVVDCRHPLAGKPVVMSRLIWSPDVPQKLEVGMVEEHLVVVDPDAEHCVLFRNAYALDTQLRGDAMLEVQGLRPVLVSALARGMKARKGTNSVTLKALLDELKARNTADASG